MTQFIARVELHNAEWSDYTTLHSAMKNHGFKTNITSGGGVVYELPPAEYRFEGGFTSSQVLDIIKVAASKTNKSYGAIVTQSGGSAWVGLKKV